MKKPIYKKAKRVRDFSFFRYFNSPEPNYFRGKRPEGLLVWSSAQRGTYVRAKHGELSTKNPR